MPPLNDPCRPAYHFTPPAHWINDPNGLIHHKGWYHVFYQHNPGEDGWGDIHWGHARSRDLLQWEHLPIALAPSKEECGEQHCFSGCCAINGKGEPVIFYTMIFGEPREVPSWTGYAMGSADLLRWQKFPRDPVMKTDVHGDTRISEWRDPFVFQFQNRTFMVQGGTRVGKDSRGVVLLYEAMDNDLLRWSYRGVIFEHPQADLRSIECPVFFPIAADRFILILSPYGPVQYWTGTFDPDVPRFNPEVSGVVDHGKNYYAANVFRDGLGRWLSLAWVNGFKERSGNGWCGCLSLPRVLECGTDGRLLQKPAPELRDLRRRHVRRDGGRIQGRLEITELTSDMLEVEAVVQLGTCDSLSVAFVEANSQNARLELKIAGDRVFLNGDEIPNAPLLGANLIELRIFADRSVFEIFINETFCCTRTLHESPTAYFFRLEADSAGAVLERLDLWELAPLTYSSEFELASQK